MNDVKPEDHETKALAARAYGPTCAPCKKHDAAVMITLMTTYGAERDVLMDKETAKQIYHDLGAVLRHIP